MSTIRLVKPQHLTLHPRAAEVPEMPADQYAIFVADVKARHMIEKPVEVIPGTTCVIDGRTRRQAAIDAGLAVIPVIDADLHPAEDPVVYMKRVALLRRHLTSDQRAMLAVGIEQDLAAKAKERQIEGGKKGGEIAGAGRPKAEANRVVADPPQAYSAAQPKPERAATSRATAAKLADVSEKKVADAKLVTREKPELAAKVATGEVKLAAAVAEVKKEKEPKPEPKPAKEKLNVTVRGGAVQFDPCPFCGGTDLQTANEGLGYFYVECRECWARGPRKFLKTTAAAREAWGRRAATGITPTTRLSLLLRGDQVKHVEDLDKWHKNATVEDLLNRCPSTTARGQNYIGALYAYLREITGLGSTAAHQIGDALVDAGFATMDGPRRCPVTPPTPTTPAPTPAKRRGRPPKAAKPTPKPAKRKGRK